MAKKKTGRKRSAVFSTRMDPALRKQLEASAKYHSGGNLSDELGRLLKVALAEQKTEDANLRAVLYLVTSVAHSLGPEWKSDPWLFAALRGSVGSILDRIAPEGEPEAPPESIKGFLSGIDRDLSPEEIRRFPPQKFGDLLAFFVWSFLQRMPTPPDGSVASRGSWSLAMPQIREVLNVPFVEDPQLAEMWPKDLREKK